MDTLSVILEKLKQAKNLITVDAPIGLDTLASYMHEVEGTIREFSAWLKKLGPTPLFNAPNGNQLKCICDDLEKLKDECDAHAAKVQGPGVILSGLLTKILSEVIKSILADLLKKKESE